MSISVFLARNGASGIRIGLTGGRIFKHPDALTYDDFRELLQLLEHGQTGVFHLHTTLFPRENRHTVAIAARLGFFS
jgi:hypothetical protein